MLDEVERVENPSTAEGAFEGDRLPGSWFVVLCSGVGEYLRRICDGERGIKFQQGMATVRLCHRGPRMLKVELSTLR